MNTIALSPEQFIFASENTLKTTSLKIAERFGKEHGNVLKAIDKILTQVSESFGEVNFNASDYEQNNNLGIPTKYRSYDLTRDGFMIVVMSFTGKPAMEIKEWYICRGWVGTRKGGRFCCSGRLTRSVSAPCLQSWCRVINFPSNIYVNINTPGTRHYSYLRL